MTRTMRAHLLLLLALAPEAARADTAPLSALPEKPAHYAQADGPLHATVATVAPSNPDYQIRAADGACLIFDPPAYWIDGDATLQGRYADLEDRGPTPFGIERLVVHGETAELERITASLLYGELVPSARSRIPLTPVAQLDGLVVYAYRWGAKVFLLSRSSGTPLRRRDGGLGLEEAPGCGVAYTMLRVRKGASEPVQIEGTVPATGKRYLVNASVTQTARDPEPLLSVTARLLDH